MIEQLKGRNGAIKLVLWLGLALSIYLIVAWASYSPLDNAWSVASNVPIILNKTGESGAWIIDVFLSLFGKVTLVVFFGVALASTYSLIVPKVELNWLQISGWCISFLILVVGLSGFASVLLENSPYYLAGGVIGGILNSSIGSQFAVLLMAVLLTAIGFYFCSGQIMVELFNRLYHWITADQTTEISSTSENLSQQHHQTAQTTNNNESQSSPQFIQSEQKLTDTSRFARPNIIGLKSSVTDNEIENTCEVSPTIAEPSHGLTDISQFKVDHQVSLPKVNLAQEVTPSPVVPSSTIEPTIPSEPISAEIEVKIPIVRLNPSHSTAVDKVVATETTIQAVKNPPEIVKVAEQTEITISPAMNTDINQTAVPVAVANQSVASVANPTVEEMAQIEVANANPTVAAHTSQSVSYPKGYNGSLIHPLLQPKTTVKPTTPLPTLDLLEQKHTQVQQITEKEILETSARLEQELANFGVKATVEDVLVGPVVTRYEIQPAPGIKGSKISSLGEDLARALIFKAIRITDSVPGKPYMGIETPNPQRETVWLRDVLDSDEFRHSTAKLPMALGKDISGKPIVVDMAKMPHLLVAGQTGGGKSVGLNSMILSLLFKLTPEQLRLIMIDPKVVELSIYNDIPHLLTPVVKDMKKAENALCWVVEEMERRYLLVSSLNVRNIDGYNAKIEQAEEMGLPIPNMLWRPGDTMDLLPPPLEKLPYIVLIVDEFADLMMSVGKQVEAHILRIAQKARAVGIHVILATQRPSTDVITGIIKANMPSRIAFTVTSAIDSRTILDKVGAESLLGNGDMLYSPSGSPEIIRIHGAYMSDKDVERVAANWRARGKPEYIDSIVNTNNEQDINNSGRSGSELDPLFDEVVQFMIDGGATSISGLQRRFSIGFNRAARIIEQLEDQGILSAPDSRNRRELLAR